MIPKECKRLAEVDFPISDVSKQSAREKSIRHGLPSTLHLWWARRPLAACRAMLLALLLPDPCDPHCPTDFKNKARELLPKVQGKVGPEDKDLQKAILKFIGNFSNWDLSSDRFYLEVGRGLVKAGHPEETPLVVDPFAGGGSIPLEALRLGCETFASDLNPVACLILKVMLEDIPRYGRQKVKVKRLNGKGIEADGLAEALRVVGKNIKEAAEKTLSEFYPPDPDGAKPIAYLWVRTVLCESPNCGAEIPLMRSFWLCKKAIRKRALRYKVVRRASGPPHVEFEIFEPKADKDVPGGTVTRAKATCLCCGTVLHPERVRTQLSEQRGGADVVFDTKSNRTGGARILAVVTVHPGINGRNYRLPTGRDYEPVCKAQKRLQLSLDEWERGGERGLRPLPNEPLPPIGTLGFRVQRYGVIQWGDFFTSRQSVALLTFASLVGGTDKIARPLSLALGKLADLSNVICPWEPIAECPRNVLSNGRVKPSWDFAEGVTTSDSSGSFSVCVDNLASGILSIRGVTSIGNIEAAAAQQSPLPDESVRVWFTDPPYYDAIPYAALSDMFFVWFKRCLLNDTSLRDPYDMTNPLTPKALEAVQDEAREIDGRKRDKSFFEDAMASAFSEGRRVLREDGIGSVVFAHKTTEGWEALLSGIIRGGMTITGSWPVATEMRHRIRARESAALATSVHLICRPRPDNAPVGDWAEVLRELPKRVGNWMERLQSEGIRGADLVFACIGPALEIFSQYSKVETSEGREVKLPEYLKKVWEVVGRIALEQVLGTAEAQARNSAVGALEEDARLTALFLWTLQSTNGEEKKNDTSKEEDEDDTDEEEDEESKESSKKKGYSLIFDVVRRFAQPLGIELPKWEKRVIETKKGVVRLLPVAERAKQLFGEEGARTVVEHLEYSPRPNLQLVLFPEIIDDAAPKIRGRATRRRTAINISDSSLPSEREATTLDRVHAAMLLQASGQSNALRSLLKAEQERSPDFLRLANALSALYPKNSEEKRLLDAMLLAVPR